MREATSNTQGEAVRFVYGACKLRGLKKEKDNAEAQSTQRLAEKKGKAPDFFGGL
jgi:hypothetical protein